MFEPQQKGQLFDTLYSIHRTLESVVPIDAAQVVLSVLGALLAVWLMQGMTKLAGLHDRIALLRLVQRCALAWLALGLLLNAASAYLPCGENIVSVLLAGALFLLLGASVILTYVQPPQH